MTTITPRRIVASGIRRTTATRTTPRRITAPGFLRMTTTTLRKTAALGFSLLLPALSTSTAFAANQSAYFQGLSDELKRTNADGPSLIIDLDRLDHNLAEIAKVTGNRYQFRATTKSLPSVGLLRYILRKMNSNRVMAFHPNLMRSWLGRLTEDTEVLMGKTVPVASLGRLWNDVGRRKLKKITG
jgi:hypothetical protein